MGTGTLTDYISGEIIEAAHPNDIHAALKVDFVGRDSSGAATPGQRLGTPLIPWGTAYVEGLVIDGQPVDPGEITAARNRIISGAKRSTSEFPDYLRPAGAGGGLQFTILGATTPLEYDVNGTIVEITTDIVKSGLTPGPSTNNTCQINDISLTGQDDTRFLGENGTFITVDNMQSELTSRIGQFVSLYNQTSGTEFIYCRIASSTRLDNIRRGFMFDDNGAPWDADVLNNNDVLLLQSLGFIFAEDNGTTIDVTYSNPVISGVEPIGAGTGDYWYDLNVDVWKRYNGSIFEEINRTFIGYVSSGVFNCTGVRPEIFGKSYRDTNTLSVALEDTDTVVSEKPDFIVSVHGRDKRFDFGFFQWDGTADFETGFTRTADRYYWLYLTEEGKPIISGYKPYDSLGFQRGWYHPYESWRAVAQVYNNGSGDFELVNKSELLLDQIDLIPDERIILSVSVSFVGTTAGRFILDDNTGFGFAPAFIKDLNVTWSVGTGGGANPGLSFTPDFPIAAPVAQFYHYFALSDSRGAAVDFGIDTDPNGANLLAYAPVVGAGFTAVSYQGTVLVYTAAFLIYPFYHEPKTRWFWWNPRAPAWTLPGYAIPTGPTLRQIAVPPSFKHKAKLSIYLDGIVAGGGPYYFLFDDPDLTSTAPSANNCNFAYDANFETITLNIVTNNSQQIREQYASAGSTIDYYGSVAAYEDLRLRECI